MKHGWIEERQGLRGVSYRARYWAPDATGVLVPRSKSFSASGCGGKRAAENAAKAYLAKMQTEVRSGAFIAPSPLTLAELTAQWIADREAEGKIGGNTAHNYLHALKHLRPDVGNLPIQQLTALHLQGLYRALRADGVGEGMLRQLHIVVNGALAQAVRWEILAKNVAQKVTKPDPKPAPIAYWTPEHLALFLEREGADRLYGLIWQLLGYTGMRIGELQALRWEDLDLSQGTLRILRTVTRTKTGETVSGSKPKTQNSLRTIPVPAPCVEPLKQHRIRQRERELAAATWDRSAGDLVFTNGGGGLLVHTTVNHAFGRAIARRDLPPIRLHGLRHSAITHMLLAGVHPKIVAELMGDTVAMILNVYSHVTYADKQVALAEHVARVTGLMAARRDAAAD